MTVRGFLAWYLGAVLFVGTAGAGGYQILTQQRAQRAAQEAAEPPATTVAAAQPVVPDTGQSEPSPSPSLSNAANTATAALHQPAATLRPFPPLRSHLTASDHVARPEWRAGRHTKLALAERPAHHPRTLAAATRTPYRSAARYVVPLRPPGGYAPPRPAVTYYAYPAYQPYPPGYGYAYAPGYPYYRVY
jgi:hypothetical protein